MRRFALALGLALVTVPGVRGQERFDAAFTIYGMEEGLSQPSVLALIQDRRGFLWVGTQDGLNRFDGTGFRTYYARPDDPNTLGEDFVLSLAEGPDSAIWVGTERAGLDRLDPLTGEIRHYPLDDLGDAGGGGDGEDRTSLLRAVYDIAVLGPDALLLRTDLGVARFEVEDGAASLLPLQVRGDACRVTATCALPAGGWLGGLPDGTVARFDSDGMGSPLAVLPDSIAVIRCRDGHALTGTYGGEVYRVSVPGDAQRLGEIPEDVDPALGRMVRDVVEAPDGGVWAATLRGAYRIDPRTGVVARAGTDVAGRDLPDGEITRLLVDGTGVLWVGTWNGLASLHPFSALVRRLPAGTVLRGGGVVAMADDGEGGLWVGAYEGGLQHLEANGPGGWIRTTPEALIPYSDAHVFGLASDGTGGVWIALLSRGMFHLDAAGILRRMPVLDWEGRTTRPLLYSVFVDRAGTVWAGEGNLGLIRYDRAAGAFRPFLPRSRALELRATWAWPIDEDDDGRLWVGMHGGGVLEVDPPRARVTMHRAGGGGLSDDRVLTLRVTRDQAVWVGTQGGGLNRLDGETGAVTLYTVEEGLPNDAVQGILEDPAGNLWISTRDGLARMVPGGNEFLILRETAGLAGSRFFANAALRDASGVLYFGGPGGISVIDPAAIRAREVAPTVALAELRIHGREAPLARALGAGGLDLHHTENFFSLRFAALDFADPGQNRYRYQLEGLEPETDPVATPVATYTSVPPGTYVFRVAARNSEGVWNPNALAIDVRVRAPFHATWWFRTSAVLVLALLAGLVVLDRFNTYRKNQQVRLDIAGRLHDDIQADLSAIALKTDMVRGRASGSEVDERQLELVSLLARDVTEKLRETVWVVNTRYDTLAELVKRLHDSADVILGGHADISFTGPATLPQREVTTGFRNEVYLFFKECCQNVLKHAEATRVQVDVRFAHRRLYLRVADDGRGFDVAATEPGNGLETLERRARACGGTAWVTSVPGKGTTVELDVPVAWTGTLRAVYRRFVRWQRSR